MLSTSESTNAFEIRDGKSYDYKCILCGRDCDIRERTHLCGNEYCMEKCSTCGEAEINCRCLHGHRA